MSIPIIDQLRPLGDFPAVDASDVQAGNERLSTRLSNTPTTAQVDAVVANKVDKVPGKGLSTNDYTNAEKSKLSGIEANANNYVHPTAAGNKHIPAGGSAGKILGWASDGTAQWVDDHNTEYSDATTSVHGLMSAADKSKLNGIEAQANKTDISTSVPATPTDGTVPSMKLVADTYASNSDLASGLATKADNSTVSALADRVTDAETDILTQTARIDSIAALPSGSTSGDAELMDIRIEADGTTANDAGTAVRNQITAVINDINALDAGNVKFRWELGGLSTSTGNEVVKTDQIRSSKHYIRPNNPIKISCGNKYFFICKYAADGTFLGYDGAWNSEHTLNYDCAYVRVCIASNTVGDGNSLNFKYTKRTFSALEKNTVIYDVVNAADYSYLLRNILFPCMFNATNEWLDIPQVSGQTQWIFISVKGTGSAYLQIAYSLNKALMFTRVAASGVTNDWIEHDCSYKDNTVRFYQPSAANVDNKLSHIFVACTFNATSPTWVDMPQDETSVIFMNVKGNGNNAFLQFAYPLTGDYFYTRVTAPNVEGTWRKYDCSEREPSDALPVYTLEKKCGCLGDSITYGLKGTSWVTKLDDYCGFTEAINYGVSGSTIKSNGVDGFLDRYQSMAADLDYIVVFGGVNDFMWTTQTKAEFKTNYESLINGLLTRYPEAKMLAVTPMKFEYTGDDVSGIISRRYDTPHQDGVVLKDYVDAEIEVLNKYSVPYIDFFNEVGISPENAAQSTAYFASATDHLHPNTNGNLKIIAPKIAEALKRL